jgi:hypothetical protein
VTRDNEREAELWCDLEQRFGLNPDSLAIYIDASPMTGRRRIATGGMSLAETRMLVSRIRNAELHEAIADYLFEHVDGTYVAGLDSLDTNHDGAIDGADAVHSLTASLRQIAAAIDHAVEANADGVIDHQERQALVPQINQAIRAAFRAKKIIHHAAVPGRKHARPLPGVPRITPMEELQDTTA